jgi:hypothetical protein
MLPSADGSWFSLQWYPPATTTALDTVQPRASLTPCLSGSEVEVQSLCIMAQRAACGQLSPSDGIFNLLWRARAMHRGCGQGRRYVVAAVLSHELAPVHQPRPRVLAKRRSDTQVCRRLVSRAVPSTLACRCPSPIDCRFSGGEQVQKIRKHPMQDARSRSPWSLASQRPCLMIGPRSGQTAVVTGASRGIGRPIAGDAADGASSSFSVPYGTEQRSSAAAICVMSSIMMTLAARRPCGHAMAASAAVRQCVAAKFGKLVCRNDST